MQESREVIMFHFVMYNMIKLSIFCQIIPNVSSEFHVELLGENLKQWFYYYPFVIIFIIFMVRSASKFYIFICTGHIIGGYCFTDSYINSNMIDTIWRHTGQTGILILQLAMVRQVSWFILFYITLCDPGLFDGITGWVSVRRSYKGKTVINMTKKS